MITFSDIVGTAITVAVLGVLCVGPSLLAARRARTPHSRRQPYIHDPAGCDDCGLEGEVYCVIVMREEDGTILWDRPALWCPHNEEQFEADLERLVDKHQRQLLGAEQ